jgi:plastocyanin
MSSSERVTEAWLYAASSLKPRSAAWAALLGLLVALSLLLIACEYPGVPSPHADANPTGSPASETPIGDQATPTPSGDQGPPALEGTVDMALKDFELVPDELVVRAGEVTFALVNEGRFTHDFRVEGEGVDEISGKLGARRSREWQVTLEPGEYLISCRISNHDKRGMVGTMTVVP